MTARPMNAVLRILPPFTGTSTSSVPFRPSPIIIWQPVDSMENPFSLAAVMCSSASLRRPTYSVLQSVRKGLPPRSLHPVGHRLGEVRPQEGKIPGFAEMQLDRHELVFKIQSLRCLRRCISLSSFSSRLVPTLQRMSVKYTFETLMGATSSLGDAHAPASFQEGRFPKRRTVAIIGQIISDILRQDRVGRKNTAKRAPQRNGAAAAGHAALLRHGRQCLLPRRLP